VLEATCNSGGVRAFIFVQNIVTNVPFLKRSMSERGTSQRRRRTPACVIEHHVVGDLQMSWWVSAARQVIKRKIIPYT
jgi:hypothetical protein